MTPHILYSVLSLQSFLKKEKPSKVCIVTSKRLVKKLRWVIRKIPGAQITFLPDGEAAKTLDEIEKLLTQFTKHNLDRQSIIVALGGGTIGDAAGFAASIYLRGVRYVQVPTTLLAQVDSAHGGKTGVDFRGYKNQVGAFYNPIAVVVDTRLLKSLSQEQVVDGLGEVIKAGLIKDPSILSLLRKANLATLVRSRYMSIIVRKSIEVKSFYIKRDPNEENIRQILNTGHTFGHAIELKYHLSHGRAVLIGLFQELTVGEALGITPLSVRRNLVELIARLGITLDTTARVDWKSVLRDKKVAGSSIWFPVIEKEGRSRLVKISLKKLQFLTC